MAQTHKFRKGKSLFATTLSSGISTGTGDTITLNSASGLPTDTEITLTFDRVDANGASLGAQVERITGTISGNVLTNYTRGVDGTTEQAHSASAVIEFIPNADDMNDLVDGILVDHDQSGQHKTLTDANGNEWVEQGATADAVNQVKVSNAATGNAPTVEASGDDSNIGLSLKPKGTGNVTVLDGNGNEVIKTDEVASAVNEVTITNAATGNPPTISVTGGDTDIDLKLIPKGTGALTVTGTTDYEDNVSDDDDIPNKKYVDDEIAGNAGSTDGWTAAGETWTYASATTFTIAGVNVTTKYSKGTRIKLTQSTGGTKYFVVASSSFSTNTTVTLAANTAHTLANEAISSPFYSYQANPQGYPNWFVYTTTYGGFSADPTPATLRYNVVGGVCYINLTATGNGTSNATTFTITVPINSGSTVKIQNAGRVVNNGTIDNEPGMIQTTSGNNSHSIKPYDEGAFTGSGNKSANLQYFYEI